MFRSFFTLIIALFSLGATAETTVTLLDRGEPYEAMTFHAGHLWVGHSRAKFNFAPKIEVFDREDKLIASVPLRHSAVYLYPYAEDAVLVVGISPKPNLSMYSVLRIKAGKVSATSVYVPMEAWATRWLGTYGGYEYFTDPGGNPNDPEAEKNLGLAAQSIFRFKPGSPPSYLKARVRLPVGGTIIDGQLFLMQRESLADDRSNLVVVDLKTAKLQAAFKSPRKYLAGLARISGGSLLAMTERAGDQLTVVDTKTLATVSETMTVREPKAIAAAGNCLLVGAMQDRNVQIVGKDYKEIMSLPMDLKTTEFARLMEIAVDVKTGRVYGRSNLACNPLAEACDNDQNRIVAWKADLTGCN